MKLCNHEISKFLHELGYDWKYYHEWLPDGSQQNLVDKMLLGYPLDKGGIPVPRLDDAAYWIREKFDICICVYPYYEAEVKDEAYTYSIHVYYEDSESWSNRGWYRGQLGYEDALETAIKEAINLIKNKNQ